MESSDRKETMNTIISESSELKQQSQVREDEEQSRILLMNTIQDLKQQNEKLSKALEDQQRRIDTIDNIRRTRRSGNSNPRRSTLYMLNTPHRVNDRTSMGGIINTTSGSLEEAEENENDDYGDVDASNDMEVGILMHDDQPFETGAGEPRPDLRRRLRRRTAGEVKKIHLERIGQRRGVHVPVVQVQAASEPEHDVADLLAIPQLAHHLVGGRMFSGSRHRPFPPTDWAA